MDDFDSVGPAGDEDFTLPRATLKKFVQDCLGEIACSKESYDLISNCCVEFIHLLSSEAMEICEKSNKKTMSAEHVFSALKTLGFESFIAEVQAVNAKHNDMQTKDRDRRTSSKVPQLSHEELLELQQRQLEEARKAFEESQRMNNT